MERDLYIIEEALHTVVDYLDLSENTLHSLLEEVRSKFEVSFEPVQVGNHTLEILQITDLESYIDQLAEQSRPGDPLELPLWAKIWPSCLLLSLYVQRLSPDSGKDLLEIGSGLGLTGLFAARQGFNVTLSDINEDALLFARINILKNGLQDKARIAKIDFTKDRLDKTFQYILACEILYKEDHFQPLLAFFQSHLDTASGSEIVLAKDHSRKAGNFFHMAEKQYHIKSMNIAYKDREKEHSGEDQHLCQLFRMRAKSLCDC